MVTHYRYKRYIGYGIITILVILMPFITINGNHILLLSFVHEQLHLLGVAFNVQEFYLLPFLLILLFIGIFFMTTLGGRMWCGWSCPQTIFRVIYRDLIETKLLGLRKKVADKQKKPNYHEGANVFKKTLAILLFCVIALIAASVFLFYFIPPKDFFAYLQDPADHKVFLGFLFCIAAFLVFDITFMAENFCVYVCPYARVQSVLFDNNTLMAIYDTKRGGMVYDDGGNLLSPPKKQNPINECINCHQCVRVCPAHIDIRKGMQLECINCLECVDACTEVMGKFNKPSLVSWSSPNAVSTNSRVKYFRAATIGYLIIILLVVGIMLFMGSKKEPMLVNIDRNTQLYEVRKNGAIDNFYVFLFENTENRPHRYYFRITNRDDIEILRPKQSIEVDPGEKLKQIVILRTWSKGKKLSNEQDVTIPLEIEIYEADNPKIVIRRKSVFVTPAMQ
ncbi:ferredoxin domain-containing integral membrane protein [Helicobacter mustelae]|uniref:cytochrome c oxidase accessory protein CcoG n=1 Tax=Helicobacter mustelae TaxID=217 RepID=UPI000E03D3B8|nr:cytochrome c oxidase accessory protein CcoG [Helicobacter mustelae]STP13317.1 ferredoxin domain-containing integral membrane protein [Helicobacter mustelae]